mgnify:CR=1 FL=1
MLISHIWRTTLIFFDMCCRIPGGILRQHFHHLLTLIFQFFAISDASSQDLIPKLRSWSRAGIHRVFLGFPFLLFLFRSPNQTSVWNWVLPALGSAISGLQLCHWLGVDDWSSMLQDQSVTHWNIPALCPTVWLISWVFKLLYATRGHQRWYLLHSTKSIQELKGKQCIKTIYNRMSVYCFVEYTFTGCHRHMETTSCTTPYNYYRSKLTILLSLAWL